MQQPYGLQTSWAIEWYTNHYLKSYPLDHPSIQDPETMLQFYRWCENLHLIELCSYLEVAQSSYWLKKCMKQI